MDSVAHKEQTGVSNEHILNNAERLSKVADSELVLRTPIIPYKNDTSENLIATAKFTAQLGVKRWDLITYHNLGEEKYKKLGRKYLLQGVKPLDNEKMKKLLTIVKQIFPKVTIENQ